MTVDQHLLASEWDRSANLDGVRTRNIVPSVAAQLCAADVSRVVDVGCATGYLPRSILRDYPDLRTEWMLVDRDPSRLDIARDHLRQYSNVSYHGGDIDSLALGTSPAVTLFLFIYTILEFESVDVPLRWLREQSRDLDQVLIVMPDTTKDVMSASLQSGHVDGRLMRSSFFENGTLALEKFDKFTNARYPFHAHRLDYVVSKLDEFGFGLASVEFWGEPEPAAYLLTATRNDQAN